MKARPPLPRSLSKSPQLDQNDTSSLARSARKGPQSKVGVFVRDAEGGAAKKGSRRSWCCIVARVQEEFCHWWALLKLAGNWRVN